MPSLKQNDYKIYFKELRASYIIWCLALLAAFILFSVPIKNIYNILVITTFLHFCPTDKIIVDLVFLGYLGFAIYFICKQFKNKLLIAPNSLTFLASIIFIYLWFFRYSPQYNFYFFNIGFLAGISYSDAFVVSTLIFIASYKSYLKPLALASSKYSLIEDGPYINDNSDIYSRDKYAIEVADHISKTTTRNSFAIGIIGEWGSGKTDFLLRLNKSLKAETDNIVFDFNPWMVSKSEAIIDDFFKTLSNELKPYNQSINSKIKDYSKKILQTGKELQYRFLDSLLGEWIADDSVQKQYTSINASIKAISKRDYYD